MLLKSLLIASLVSFVNLRHLNCINKREKTKLKDDKLQLLFHHLPPKDREYLDGIAHFRSNDESYTEWQKIKDIENDFHRSIAMEGMSYIYKRDLFWRTRRKVIDGNVGETSVNYMCHNLFTKNDTVCENCGQWILEENPPCPYEFYSMIDNDRMCAFDYFQTKAFNDSCPMILKFLDLPPSCDNPMETLWRFTREYNPSETYSKVICDGKDYCEIFTTYLISRINIIFRMINSTNDVIYSRIMKPNNTNYVCVNDCGRYNPLTRTVTKINNPKPKNPLSPTKIKRDLPTIKEDTTAASTLKKNELSLTSPRMTFRNGGKIVLIDGNDVIDDYSSKDKGQDDYIFNLTSPETTTMSNCAMLQKRAEYSNTNENYDDIDNIMYE